MNAPIITSKAANALFTSPHGATLWVGGKVTLTGTTLQFHPNDLNKLTHAPLGGVSDARVDLCDVQLIKVGNELVTKAVTILHTGGGLTFRCYGALAFAEKIRQAAVATGAHTTTNS